MKVSCMVVVGNTAIVGGRDRTGIEVLLIIEDNGDTVSHAIGLLRADGNFTVADA